MTTEMPRQSAFMPTVKCSDCGHEVEISLMGDHLCSGAPEAAEPPPPVPPLPDLFGGAFSSLKQNVLDKFTKTAPPTVDTSAATYHPNTRNEQLTPVSVSTGGSQTISPKTPNARLSSGRNTGDFFEPAIVDSPPTQHHQRPGGYGGFDDESGAHYEGGDHTATTATTLTASPPRQKSSLLTRMNSIAPGPFEMDRRPSTAMSNRLVKTPEPLDDAQQPYRRPSYTGSTTPENAGPPRQPRQNGYGGFGAPPSSSPKQDELAPGGTPPFGGLGKRSETFPKVRLGSHGNEAVEGVRGGPERSPSAPGRATDHRVRSNTGDTYGSSSLLSSSAEARPSVMPRPAVGSMKDTTRAPPPRKSLMPARDGIAPTINLANEFGVDNPYHTPSMSMSSSNSGYSQYSSQPSQSSLGTSPTRSIGSRSGGGMGMGAGMRARKGSDATNVTSMDDLMDELEASVADNIPGPALPPPRMMMPPGPPAGILPYKGPHAHHKAGSMSGAPQPRRPPPSGLRLDPTQQVRPGPRTGPLPATTPLRSPMFPPPPQRKDSTASSAPSYASSGASSRSGGGGGGGAHTRSRSGTGPARPRGSCKACREPIVGKSVSSADGRLTGRYHKPCFVCTTCREPFSGTTFYVLRDQPYCEQHYHALNDSLCGGCHRGIEGQYLEDEPGKKYHIACFRCGDCGVVLRDGYFDADDGGSYCERDALRRRQRAARGVGAEAGPPPIITSAVPETIHEDDDGQNYEQGFGGGGHSPLSTSPSPRELNRPFGLPTGCRLAPGQALSRGALGGMPRMEKRMTRLGMMAGA